MLFMPREEYRAYSRRLLPYLLSSFAVFAAGIVLGVMIVSHRPDLGDQFAAMLSDFVKMFSGMPPWKLVAAIFFNNSLKTLFAILLGVLFGIAPGIFLLANGVALGVALSLSIQTRGVFPSLLSILPHGIIELPAVFLGTSIGLLLGTRAIKRLFRRSTATLREEIVRGVRFYCTVIVPLLMLAALVEVFVTAALVSPR